MSEFRFKQVIVLRTDIKMSKGKLAVQACHASVGALEETRKEHRDWVRSWFDEGQKKVVAKVRTIGSLEKLKQQADKMGLPNALVEDRGLTEIPPGTVTSLGIGPAPEEIIDKVTHDLVLL
ncbi:MAG: peptidyl-tRNA hydrolase Pth2 [Candidatus Atabeyarchaeum deiterrae]|jgi:PTH2 family peptidyl-tRNA hydrolase